MKINTDLMNMDALDFDGDMWDPEYCDSELRAVEASGDSRDEWPRDAMHKKCSWNYP